MELDQSGVELQELSSSVELNSSPDLNSRLVLNPDLELGIPYSGIVSRSKFQTYSDRQSH